MYCSACGHQISDQAIACPNCGVATKNFVQPDTPVERVAIGTIVCAYLLALIAPLFGMISGAYLVSKKEQGHGLACMLISLLSGLFIFKLMNS
jgi:DNA-directed RNA polymerase subunit RPC12/RpoP